MKKFIVDYFGEFSELEAENLKHAFVLAVRFSYRNVRSITDEMGKEFMHFELINLS